MLDYLLRFLARGIAVSAFAALGDALRPKTFAGLFGTAPSIELATLLITLSNEAQAVAVEARSMILGALALAAYSWTVCILLRSSECRRLPRPWRLFSSGCSRRSGLPRSCSASHDHSAQSVGARETSWHEYLVRFALGGAMTVVAGLIAAGFGPVLGGLFLAFPAIFPASVTLVEKHVRERRGRVAARKRRRSMLWARRSAVLGLRSSLRSSGSRLGGSALGFFSRRRRRGSRPRRRPGSCAGGCESRFRRPSASSRRQRRTLACGKSMSDQVGADSVTREPLSDGGQSATSELSASSPYDKAAGLVAPVVSGGIARCT